MKTVKKILLSLFAFALVFALAVSFGSLSVKADAEEAAVYDISEVSNLPAGGEVNLKISSKTTPNVGSIVNFGDTVKFLYKMRTAPDINGNSSRGGFGIGSYGIYFYCRNDSVSFFTVDIERNGLNRKTDLSIKSSRQYFVDYNEITVKADKKDDSTVTLTVTYHEGDETKTITTDFAYVASSDMKFRFGDFDIDGTYVKSAKEAVIYDVSEVYPEISEGGELSMACNKVYSGNAVGYGESVKLLYKMRSEHDTYDNYARSAFGIGSYGVYFKCTGDVCDIWNATLTDGSIARGASFAKLSRSVFTDYNEITFMVFKKSDTVATLVMTYHDGDEVKVISKDYDYVAASDMKFRFGDGNFDGNVVKSTLPAPTFGDGSFKYAAGMDGVNFYGACNLTVIDGTKADKQGVPAGYTAEGNVIKMTNSADAGMDMAFDFSSLNYKRKFLTEIKFRVYVVGTSSDDARYPEVRIPHPTKKGEWVKAVGQGATKTDEWTEVTVSGAELDRICVDGYLKMFALSLRTAARTTMYVDKVEISTVEMEYEKPVINAPVTEFKVSEGAYPAEFTATDNSGNVEVTYAWSEGALDDLGRLKRGTHTCVVTATDFCDNVSTVTVTYIVEPDPELALYKVIFRATGFNDIVVEYCEDEIDYFVAPKTPEKEHYKSMWKAFKLEKTQNQVVECDFVPVVYTVTYMVGGEVFATRTYTVLDILDFSEPDVPAKKGFKAEWSEYELNFSDITVTAVYTEIKDEPTDSTGGESGKTPEESSNESLNENSGESRRGCSSSVGAASVSVFGIVLAAAFIFRKKEKKS